MNKNIKDIIILINLGSPKHASVPALQRYLFQFLMDRHVIDIPFFQRLLLVGGIIAPFRAFPSAKAYAHIWQKEGSPLIINTRLLAGSLSDHLKKNSRYAQRMLGLLVAMRYQSPSIKNALRDALALIQQSKDKHFRLRFIPLYPHYAISTTLSSYLQIKKDLNWFFKKLRSLNTKNKYLSKSKNPTQKHVSYSIKPPFCKDQRYLKALAESIAPYTDHLGEAGGYDFLLFSYHGLPVRHLTKIEPSHEKNCFQTAACCETKTPPAKGHNLCYRHQVLFTSEEIIKRLSLNKALTLSSFQSRLGRTPWIEPFTCDTVRLLAKKGVRKLLVVCPAFVSDNLETLLEVADENTRYFREAGGLELKLIPCLNIQPSWVRLLAAFAQENDTLPSSLLPEI